MTEHVSRLNLSDFAGASGSGSGTSLAAKLERRFGLGSQPLKRRALYTKLELLVDQNPAVENLVKEAAADATGKNQPDRYFCRAIVLKLRENGCVPEL